MGSTALRKWEHICPGGKGLDGGAMDRSRQYADSEVLHHSESMSSQTYICIWNGTEQIYPHMHAGYPGYASDCETARSITHVVQSEQQWQATI